MTTKKNKKIKHRPKAKKLPEIAIRVLLTIPAARRYLWEMAQNN